jgi:hypothetical protein
MTQAEAGSDDGEPFQEFLWSLLDNANRQRLVEFDENPWSIMSLSDKVNLAAAAHQITFLCSELEDPREGFEALVARLQQEEKLPPRIAFFEGYPGASIAVACLSSFDLYGDAGDIESFRRVVTLLLKRLA